MKRTRIIHIIGGMNRGGAETFLMNVLRNIDRERFELLFLCYGNKKFDYEKEIISLGGKIIRTSDVKDVGAVRHIKEIEKILRQERVDIVHAHTYFNSMFSLIAAKRANVRLRIIHSHSTKSEDTPSLYKKLYFILSKYIIHRYANRYLACGNEAGKSLFYKNDQFTVVENGIVLDNFRYSEKKKIRLRKTLSVPSKDTVIMHVGRFEKPKNHEFLIDVYKEYRKLNPDSILVLVGDGSLREVIENKVQKLQLQGKVKFLGKRSDVENLYNVADLFLFPSLFEGLPLVLIEAQANGLPCLISDAVDKGIKVTDCIHFQPLTESAQQWARRLNKIGLLRVNTSTVLKNSSYDMASNIKSIEALYNETGN